MPDLFIYSTIPSSQAMGMGLDSCPDCPWHDKHVLPARNDTSFNILDEAGCEALLRENSSLSFMHYSRQNCS